LNQVTNCIFNVPNDKIVVAQGLDGYIVAESDNAILICPKEKEQEIKKYIADIKNK
jgi:mannose-1-phosphate guanylyltransferase